MIQNVLREIGGVGLYGVISICLFCLVFSGVLIKACALSKSAADNIGRLPLADGTKDNNSIGKE